MFSESLQRRWERRLRSFCILGGTAFIASLLVARPLTESFELMWQVVPLVILVLFALLIAGGTVWLMLQLMLAHQVTRDMELRGRPMGLRSWR